MTLTAVGAAGYGLVFASRYSDGRSVSKWTSAEAPAVSQREARPVPVGAVARTEQRTKAQPSFCASQTWPNITPECITGTAEPAKVTERPVPNVEPPSSILLKPTKAPDLLLDPDSTGSLPVIASTRRPIESTRTTEPRGPRAEIRKAKKVGSHARVERSSHARADGRRSGETRPRKNPLPAAVAQGRRKNPLSAAVAQEPPAAPPSARVSEPIQFRLADRGN